MQLKVCHVFIVLFFVCLFFKNQAVAKDIKTWDIRNYGAKSEKDFNNAKAIQEAIDAAAQNGGGLVLIPEGVYTTGTLELKSNVELHLAEGAVLQGSQYRKDYDGFPHLSLLIAFKQHDISITGKGTIDGNGRKVMDDILRRLKEGSLQDPDWKVKRPRESSRVNLFYFEECHNISVKDVFCKDASAWVTHYERSKNINIDNIRLESMAYWNNDGIDIVDCKNVRITNSFINSADDAICLKSNHVNDFCDSIYVENCILRSSANAFKLGTGSTGGFKNITVKNLTVYDTYRSAIALEAVDGGFLENIDIRNIKAKNTGNAVLIRLGHRNRDERYSTVKNIYIKDMQVEVPLEKPDKDYEMEGPLLKYPPMVVPGKNEIKSISPWNWSAADKTAIEYKHNVFPSSVCGLPNHPVENVRLENIDIVYHTRADKSVNSFPLDSFNVITEAESDYPEFSMYGELPVWGFYVRHVNGFTLNNCRVTMKGEDFRVPYLLNDAKNVLLKKVSARGKTGKPKIFINSVTAFKQE